MRRRDVLAMLGGAVAASPLAVRAQESGRTYRIGSLSTPPRGSDGNTGFYDGLSRLGLVEGKNLEIDEPGYGLRPEQFARHAAELVTAKADVIVCAGAPAIRAVAQADEVIE